MPSPATHVAAHIAAQALGVLASQGEWGVYVGAEPPTPDSCITVYDTCGNQVNPEAGQDPTMQVRVRSHSYSDAYAKAEAIRDAFLVPTAIDVAGFRYCGFWLTSDIAQIGRDSNNRFLLVFNLRSMRKEL